MIKILFSFLLLATIQAAAQSPGTFRNVQFKVDLADTAGMLEQYRIRLNSLTATKLNISDSAGMLSVYRTRLNALDVLVAAKAAAVHTHVMADITDLEIGGTGAPINSPAFTGTPTAPTPAAATNTTQIATAAFVQSVGASNAIYRTILNSTGSHTAARVAGTYWIGQGQPIGITGTGTLYAPNVIYLDPADFPTVDGKVADLRVKVQLYTNDVAPSGNYTFGLYPVTRPGTSGAAGLGIFTMGTVVASSTVLFTAPAADGLLQNVSADFAVPSAGHYVIGVITTAAVAASSHVLISAQLQFRNN